MAPHNSKNCNIHLINYDIIIAFLGNRIIRNSFCDRYNWSNCSYLFIISGIGLIFFFLIALNLFLSVEIILSPEDAAFHLFWLFDVVSFPIIAFHTTSRYMFSALPLLLWNNLSCFSINISYLLACTESYLLLYLLFKLPYV